MTIIDRLSSGIKTKAQSSIIIQEATIVKNDIGEDEKTWNDKYTFDSIFYSKRNIGQNEESGKIKIEAFFKARFNLSEIGGAITNISEKDRIVKDSKNYKIEFIDIAFSDHVVLFLTLIK